MCRIDYADDEWVNLGDSHPKARQAHKCTDCGREIAKGETYRYIKGLSEGSFYVTKECAHCEAASKWLVAVCSGYLLNGVGEELQEHWEEEPDLRCATLGRLCIGHRRRWDRILPAQVASWTSEAVTFAKKAIEHG